MNYKFYAAQLLLAAILSGVLLEGAIAQTWFAAGSRPQDYEMGGDPTVDHGDPNGGFIRSTASEINGFGTWMTQMNTGQYLGLGIRLTAYVKTDSVENWVGLWMRVDGVDGPQSSLSFDNMGSRSITGTTDWEKHEIILDVPENATQIYFGILLRGTGEAYIDGLELELAPRTWAIQNSGTSEFIYSLQATDENTVWAGASNGTYLRTIDGGVNWASGTVPGVGSLILNSIAAIDADTAYFVATNFSAADTRIYKTTDGGANWTMQYQNTGSGAFFNSIAFWDDRNGIAVSDAVNGSFVIVTTNDGGANWNEVPAANIPPPLPGEFAGFGGAGGTPLAVAGSNHVWFGTAYGVVTNDPVRVFRSTDLGQTWTADTTELSTSGFHGIPTMAFKDTLTGFAGSTFYPYSDSATTLVKTTDGGQTWSAVSSFFPIHPATVTYVPGTNDSILFITSAQGAAYSGDGGTTWTRRSTQSYYASSFASPTVGWAAGGRIVKYVPEQAVAIEDEIGLAGFGLSQNYPNPFQHATTIPFTLGKRATVQLKVYDILGREVATLVDETLMPGTHEAVFETNNLASGDYVYLIRAGDFVQAKKLKILK